MTLTAKELNYRANQDVSGLSSLSPEYLKQKKARRKLGLPVRKRKRGRKALPKAVRRKREAQYQHEYYLKYTKPKRQEKSKERLQQKIRKQLYG